MEDRETKHKTKLLMQLQMEELRATYGIKDVGNAKKIASHRPQDAAIAGLWTDIAEYEQDLLWFEQELIIIKTYETKDIVGVLKQQLPDSESDYTQEIKAVLVAGWTQLVDAKKTHPQEQLEVIKNTDTDLIAQTLTTAFADYEGDFETELKNILIKQWETLIEIKKEHIKEEKDEIKTSGLKPDYAKKIYNRYHGIE